MKNTLTIDPTTALMLSNLEVNDFGQVRARRGDLRRRQRRFEVRSRLLRILA